MSVKKPAKSISSKPRLASAARNIAELIEAATGINLWAEWAELEIAAGKLPYSPPKPRDDYAGILVSLARQEHPDTSQFNDPEIVWRMDKPHHIGLIVQSPDPARVQHLLERLRPPHRPRLPRLRPRPNQTRPLTVT